MNDTNHFMPFTNCTNLFDGFNGKQLRDPAESKDFGLLGGKACLFTKEVFEMFRIWY